MPLAAKLTDFLEKNGVPYEIIKHAKRYTAWETAVAEEAPTREFAKVVMAKTKGKDLMFVIPANHKLDLSKIIFELGTEDVHIERENEFKSLFPDCEIGAMPPFGSLYQIPCYVDTVLTEQEEIFFNAGGHEESIKIATNDYLRLAEAEIGDYSTPEFKKPSEGYAI